MGGAPTPKWDPIGFDPQPSERTSSCCQVAPAGALHVARAGGTLLAADGPGQFDGPALVAADGVPLLLPEVARALEGLLTNMRDMKPRKEDGP